jgi:CxxC-x17-CxxC domain-containing protein
MNLIYHKDYDIIYTFNPKSIPMSDFKKNYKQGGARQGGFSRPSFGGGRPQGRSFGGPTETFKADCSKCGDVCEVPFRPNGKKPVFCRNCFVRDDSRDTRRPNDFGNRREAPERSMAPRERATPDPRIDAMQKELAAIHGKLDALIESLESSAYASIISASSEREAAPAKKAAPKAKAASKKAPAKKK